MSIQNLSGLLVFTMVTTVLPTAILGQGVVITSFPGNGELTWTNVGGLKGFSVEWAPSLEGPWSRTWEGLDSILTTQSRKTVQVPMFYRVVQGFTREAFGGVWISDPPDLQYLITTRDGVIREVSMFGMRQPPGFYEVSASGDVTVTLKGQRGDVLVLQGQVAGPDRLSGPPPFTGGLRRLDDPARCAGRWTGTFVETTPLDSTNRYDVTFVVDTNGCMTGLAGFDRLVLGSLFALPDGGVVGALETREEHPYNRIHLSGTMTADSVNGVYETDSGPGPDSTSGTVSLLRE